jgi:hypothetical protein
MHNPYNNPKDILNNNAQINKYRKDRVEKYILDINSKLCELSDFLLLDIHEELNNEIIQKAKSSQNKTSFESARFGDIGKKEIIDNVLAQEKEENFRKEAIEAAGITMKELSKSEKDICAELKKPINSIAEAEKGTPPPKTDWKREGVSTSEKDKIIKSLRANPKSSVFSKEFQWQPEEFLEAFNYLESSAKYNGPFIISVADNREELKKYSGIKILSKGIEEMYFGKYVLLSVYDIKATGSNPNESKHIYMGLRYISMAGRLEFDCIGSTDSGISNKQRLSAKEYLDAMDILYDEDDKDLKVRI